MKKFREVLSMIILIGGFIAGLILPVYLFVNGIFEIIISVEPFSAVGLTIGILKVVFCELGFLIVPVAALLATLIDN